MSLSALLYRVIITAAYYLWTIYSNNLLQKSPGWASCLFWLQLHHPPALPLPCQRQRPATSSAGMGSHMLPNRKGNVGSWTWQGLLSPRCPSTAMLTLLFEAGRRECWKLIWKPWQHASLSSFWPLLYRAPVWLLILLPRSWKTMGGRAARPGGSWQGWPVGLLRHKYYQGVPLPTPSFLSFLDDKPVFED